MRTAETLAGRIVETFPLHAFEGQGSAMTVDIGSAGVGSMRPYMTLQIMDDAGEARSECVPSHVATFLLLSVPKSSVDISTFQGIDTFNIDALEQLLKVNFDVIDVRRDLES